MEAFYPKYYQDFHCLAGNCPDSCCQSWEVVVDDATYARYLQIPGNFVQALQSAMTIDSDGDRILRMENGKCPFWNQDGLCEIELRLGQGGPCATCRKFPRIVQDYEVFAEHDLSFACPEAVRLVLETETELPPERYAVNVWPEAYDGGYMESLLRARYTALQILNSNALRFSEKLILCLQYSQWFQRLTDGEDVQPFAAVAFPSIQRGNPTDIFRFYENLEILTSEWHSYLNHAVADPPTPADYEAAQPTLAGLEKQLTRWSCYRLRRCWLQAVADYDVLGKVKRLVCAWAVLHGLLAVTLRDTGAADLFRLVQLYEKEIEHDGENLDALDDALFAMPCFAEEKLISLL